jgi:hypothetical protein
MAEQAPLTRTFSIPFHAIPVDSVNQQHIYFGDTLLDIPTSLFAAPYLPHAMPSSHPSGVPAHADIVRPTNQHREYMY